MKRGFFVFSLFARGYSVNGNKNLAESRLTQLCNVGWVGAAFDRPAQLPFFAQDDLPALGLRCTGEGARGWRVGKSRMEAGAHPPTTGDLPRGFRNGPARGRCVLVSLTKYDTRNVEAFSKRTAAAYRQNLALSPGSGRHTIVALSTSAPSLRVPGHLSLSLA